MTFYVSSAVSLADPRGLVRSRFPCLLSQSKIFDDLVCDLRSRRPDVDADCWLIRGRFLEVGKLAVKQARAHEVVVACGQPRRYRRPRPGQKNEYHARTSSIDQVSVRTFHG